MRAIGVLLITLLAPVVLPTGSFDIRGSGNRVEFSLKDNCGGVTGTTDVVAGSAIVRQRGGDYAADVDGRVDARTIRTGIALRDAQMRSAMILDTTRFPFITFAGTASADAPAARQVKAVLRGRLTIKDVTRPLQMPIDVTAGDQEFGARGEVVIKMSDFGIQTPRFLLCVVEDPVTVRLQLTLLPRE